MPDDDEKDGGTASTRAESASETDEIEVDVDEASESSETSSETANIAETATPSMLDTFEEEDDDEADLAEAEGRVGRTLKDKWVLDKLIGVGGMAAVYAATHRNGKQVAVKMLHPEFSADRDTRRRFLREGYVANKVKHRGAVMVDDDDVDEEGAAFLVMELLEGEPLDARLERKGGVLPTAEVLSLIDQVLDTLIVAHEAGVIHRDLKPENLFLTRDGTVKVLDFGIARLREASASTQKTQKGSMMGTPSFMPPEQARARWDQVDARSDVWAIGACMFNLMTGRFVHEADTVTEAIALAITTHAKSIGSITEGLHPSVVSLVDKALAYAKKDRWQSAAEMQAALREAYGLIGDQDPASMPRVSMASNVDIAPEPIIPSTIQASRTSPTATTGRGLSNTIGTQPGRNAMMLGAGAAALIIFGAGAAFFFSKGDPPPSESPTPAAEAPAPEPPKVAKPPPSTAETPSDAVDDDLTFETLGVDDLPIAETDEEEAKEDEGAAENPAETTSPKKKRRRKKPRVTAQKPAAAATPKPAPAPAPASASDFLDRRY